MKRGGHKARPLRLVVVQNCFENDADDPQQLFQDSPERVLIMREFHVHLPETGVCTLKNSLLSEGYK